jgi:hypothetical protein
MTSPSVAEAASRRADTPSAPVPSLVRLVGAHPDTLARFFSSARPADPADLGDAPRGYLLAAARGGDVFLALRPLLRALSRSTLVWRGKTFDHGGNSGQNVFFGRRVLRFQAEVGPSRLDGLPALILSYDHAAHANPWPVRTLRGELRAAGEGMAMGPVLGPRGPLLWFGLTRHDGG